MKLLISLMSPFVRKVRIVAREAGFENEIEEIDVIVSPVVENVFVRSKNPLGKIPVLIRQDGIPVYDSPVICEYLDSLNKNKKLFPAIGENRWNALRHQALADGLLDAAVSLCYETSLRPDWLRWGDWIVGQQAKLDAALDMLNLESDFIEEDFNIGSISIICALGYLDFRFPTFNWRTGRDDLANWYNSQMDRPSVRATKHSG